MPLVVNPSNTKPNRNVNKKMIKTLKDFCTVRGSMVGLAIFTWGRPSSSVLAKRIKTRKVVIFKPPAVPPGAPPKNI